MQDLHAVVGGRIFDSASIDRRLRPHGNHHHALKCPRCDSLNTKFCYYNNYNLSQPRYFCKSCRRYWTKGGVLRNVPVGGGCRKNKRSKVKITPTNTASTTSSSESSGLTAATAEVVCASNCGGVISFVHGAFTDLEGLMAASVSDPISGGFHFSNRAEETCQQNSWQHQDRQIPGTFLDQTVQVDLASLQSGFTPLDWQSCRDQGWVDLASTTVDPAYCSQSQIQWTENDQPCLYLP